MNVKYISPEELEVIMRSSPVRAKELLNRQLIYLSVALSALMLVTALGENPLKAVAIIITLWFFVCVAVLLPRKFGNEENGNSRLSGEMRWPSYTVMSALYKEEQMVGRLMGMLGKLVYPGDVQFIILLEEDDKATLKAVLATKPAENWLVLVVPSTPGPRTKPRALNVGLSYATGELVVVYDAEDIVETWQLVEAAETFAQADAKVGALQFPLVVTNDRGNLWTALFSAAYELHFKVVLPWLSRLGFAPLGGTSFHIRTSVLRKIGGWDPYNVTEDLGLTAELAARQLDVKVCVNSFTLEEAPTTFATRLRQMTRWQKGYLVTWLAYWDRPSEVISRMGLTRWIVFNLVVGGGSTLPILNLLMWTETILYFVTRSSIIEQLYPVPIYLLGVTLMVFGNFVFAYLGLAASLMGKKYHLPRWLVVFTPVHWLMVSLATLRGYAQVVNQQASLWEKTPHVIHSKEIPDETALAFGSGLGHTGSDGVWPLKDGRA